MKTSECSDLYGAYRHPIKIVSWVRRHAWNRKARYIKFLCGCDMRLLLRSLRAYCVEERHTYSQCLWMSSLIPVESALMCGHSCFIFTRGENDEVLLCGGGRLLA
jgi:hypothetical protein